MVFNVFLLINYCLSIAMTRQQVFHKSWGCRKVYFGISILTICVFISNCQASRILIPFMMPYAPRSHHIAIESIARGLSERGHHITILISNSSIQHGIHALRVPANKTIVFRTQRSGEDEIKEHQQRSKVMQDKTTSPLLLIKLLYTAVGDTADECDNFFQQTDVVNELISDDYDVVLSHPFMPCEVLVASYLQTVSVVVTSSMRLPSFHEDVIGMPLPTAYVPNVLTAFTDNMTYWQRLQNLILRASFNILTQVGFYRPFSRVQQKHNISIDKTVAEMHSDTALWLCHVDRTLDWARPATPNWIPIGGITAGPAEILPQDLEEFVQGSGDEGIIIFSLGAVTHGLYDEELAEIFATVFGRLQQRVLWRQEGTRPKSLARNTKLVDWLPQNDIIGHPKTRLLIYHGGSNGVHEAVYHAVPMVIIPFAADQFALGAVIQSKNIGLLLNKYDVTEESLESTINTVLSDPRFKKNMEHLSAIFHDSPDGPQERAVFWIEHVMKFGGDHLRPRAADMSFVELYMIDVAVFLIMLCLFTLYLEYLVLKKCLICCNCIKSKEKSKAD